MGREDPSRPRRDRKARPSVHAPDSRGRGGGPPGPRRSCSPFRGHGSQLAHTSALRDVSAVPIVATTAEGDSEIGRFLERGEKVRLRLDVQNVLTAGPVESANVVGEIPGAEQPEEIVLVGAHLDSWDLGDGATDNGFGVACVLGAASAISSSGLRPRRTIRFVLFTGEEQGFLGSLAYTRARRGEMRDFVAALVLDSGQGPITALDLGGREDLVPAVEKFAAAIRGFGDIRVDDRTEFGTDTLPFTLEGVPGINLSQDSPTRADTPLLGRHVRQGAGRTSCATRRSSRSPRTGSPPGPIVSRRPGRPRRWPGC